MLNETEVINFVGKQGIKGLQNSQGVNAQFRKPDQLVYSNRENFLLVTDHGNNLIRKITMEGDEKIKITKKLTIYTRKCQHICRKWKIIH